jgi:hypothetical protein
MRFFSRDIGLRRARGVRERDVTRVQVDRVGDLVGHHRTAVARVIGPAGHAGLEERAVDDQLPAALEELGQARPAVWAVELIGLLHRQPRHPPPLRGERVVRAGHFLLLHQQLLARLLPLLFGHDLWRLHCGTCLSFQRHVCMGSG